MKKAFLLGSEHQLASSHLHWPNVLCCKGSYPIVVVVK